MIFSRREMIGVAGAASLAACGKSSSGAGIINIVHTAGTTNVVLEALITRMGYLRDLGVTAQSLTVSDGTKVVAALLSGHADLCPSSGFTQVLAAVERGAALRLVAGGASKNFNALVSGNPQVRKLTDLEGRTVGIGALGTQLHQTMIALFHKYHVDAAKVRFVNVGGSIDVLKAVMAGVVDAGLAEVWLQHGTKLHFVEEGLTFQSLPEFVNQAGFASLPAISAKRDIIVRTLAGYARLYRFIMTGDSEKDFVAASVDALGSKSADLAREQWKFYRSIQPFAASLELDPARIEFMQKLNIATGVQRQVLPFDKVADPSLARDALGLIRS